jgi:CheY-like chemotaxis protein
MILKSLYTGMAVQENPDTSSDANAPEVTVLFVDDEPQLLDLYGALFQAQYDVRTAESGTEALEQFGPHIDCAFVDRRMPGMNGSEVIQTLRERGYTTPIGIVSAVDPDMELGVDYDSYLTKPVDKDKMQRIISQYVS